MPYPVPPPPPPPLVAASIPADASPSAPISSTGRQSLGDRAGLSTPPSFLSPPERFPSEPAERLETGTSFLLAEQANPIESTTSPQEALLLGPPLQVEQPADLSDAKFGVSALDLNLAVSQPADQDITIQLQHAPAADSELSSGTRAARPGLPDGGSANQTNAGGGDRSAPAETVTVAAEPQADPNLVHQVRSSLGGEAAPELTQLVESSRSLMVELFHAVETGQVEAVPPAASPVEANGTGEETEDNLPDPTAPPPTETPPTEADPSEADPAGPPPAAPATPEIPAAPADPEVPPVADSDALEVTADRQIYDRERQSFIAEGNAIVTFREAVLRANRVQVNIPNRIAVAEGDVVFIRGEQTLRGDRIEYNLVRQDGTVVDARGEVFIPQAGTDLDVEQQVPEAVDPLAPDLTLSERLAQEQPQIETATTTGGLTIGVGIASGPGTDIQGGLAAGTVQQLRFEADRIDFRPGGWEATGVRVTNDPFSPPELEIRSNRATFTRLSPTRSELRLQNPRLVFDQQVSIPLLRERYIFDQRQRDPLPFQFGFDEDERGGFFVQTTFEPILTPNIQFTVIPQVFLQRAIDGGESDEPVPIGEEPEREGFFSPDNYGVIANLDIEFGPRTTFGGNVILTSFDLDETDDELRGSVRLQRLVLGRHTLTTEFSYRDRLFNGTLGFQTVRRTFGAVLASPIVRLGDSGIELTYQAGIQRINDEITEDRRDDLLPPLEERDNNRATLTRYQLAAEVRRFLFLWTGTPLPATPDEGLRYTPAPVFPFVAIQPRIRGIAGLYSSGDTQPILTGEISLFGQFGHFSRPFFDYLGFNLSYRRSTEGPESPFDFDRLVDREVLSGGATVQLIGPFRIGFQTSISLDNDEGFDTSYILEYSRRTYGLVASYNPDREIGTLSFRLSDFAWTGTPERFDATGTAGEIPDSDLPATPDPALENPVIDANPAPEEPAIEDPATQDPALENPAIEDSTLEEPVIEDPAIEADSPEEPASDRPMLEAPTPDTPTPETPADRPTSDRSSPAVPSVEHRLESPAIPIPVIEPPVTGGTAPEASIEEGTAIHISVTRPLLSNHASQASFPSPGMPAPASRPAAVTSSLASPFLAPAPPAVAPLPPPPSP